MDFQKEMKVDETIDKFKARLVAKSFTQKQGIDYFDTYSPVARIATIRLLITIASIHKLVIYQMEVKIAFGIIRLGHVNIRILHDMITSGVITIDFVRSNQNLVDPLTKGLIRLIVNKTSRRISLKPIELNH